MRTNLYLKHANKNFEYFENKAQYDNSYRIFLSNIIFPATNVKKWNDEIKADFIYYLDLYKLSKKLPINEMKDIENHVISKVELNREFHNKINEGNLKFLNDVRPVLILRKECKNFDEQIRLQSIPLTDNLIGNRLG